MQNFTYYNPTTLVFGKGSIARLSTLLPGKAKILLTYGGGSIKKNGAYEQVSRALHGREVIEFGGIEPNPRYETCMKAVNLVRAEGADFLLASAAVRCSTVRSSSPPPCLTRAKTLGHADQLGFGSRQSAADRLCVDLAATGSEANGGSVVTRESTKDKLFFVAPQNFPRFSILDPETTYTLPPRQTANGVVDAFVHTTEQYLTYPADARCKIGRLRPSC